METAINDFPHSASDDEWSETPRRLRPTDPRARLAVRAASGADADAEAQVSGAAHACNVRMRTCLDDSGEEKQSLRATALQGE